MPSKDVQLILTFQDNGTAVLKNASKEGQRQFNALGSGAKVAAGQVDVITKKLVGMVPTSKKVATNVAGLSKAMNILSGQGYKTKDMMAVFEKKIEAVYADAVKLRDVTGKQIPPALQKMHSTLKQTKTQGLDKVAEATKKTTTGMGRLRGALKSTWGQMAMGMGAMFGVQMAFRKIIAAFKGMIDAGQKFEREWANTTTMLSISVGETEKLKGALMDMSPTLGSTTELAQGMYQVLSASIEPAKAIQFLGEAAKAAKAGVTTTTIAVDALTTVINSYGMAAEDVTKVSDIMFMTVKRGKTTYEQLAGALGTITPIASQVGVSFEEVSAAVALMTRKGINVNTATTQLRQIMVSVLKPTKDAADMAKKLGINFSATALRAKGLTVFLQEIQEKSGGDAEALTALFGNIRALGGVMALGGTQADEFANDLERMMNAAGSAEEAFQKQMKTSAFWIDTLKNASEKFKISFYLGMVEPMVEGIETSKELDQRTRELTDAFKLLGNMVSATVLPGFTKMTKLWALTQKTFEIGKIAVEGYVLALKDKQLPTMKNIAKAYVKEQEHVEGLAATIDMAGYGYVKFKEFIGKATEATLEDAMAIAERTNEILRLHITTKEANSRIAELKITMDTEKAAAKAAAEAQDEHSEALQKVTQKLLDMAPGGASATMTMTGLGIAMDKLGTKGFKTTDMVKIFGKQITSLYEDAEKLQEMTGKAVPDSLAQMYASLQRTKSIISDNDVALKGLSETFDGISSGGTKAFTNFGNAVGGALGKVIGVSEEAQNSTDNIVGVVDGGMDNILKKGDEVEESFAENAEGMKQSSSEIGNGLSKLSVIFRTLSDGASDSMDKLLNGLSSAFSAVSTYLGDLEDGAKASIGGIASAIAPMAGQIGGALGEMASGAEEGADSFAGLGSSLGSTIGKMTGLGPVAELAGSLLGGFIGGLFEKKPPKTEAERLLEQLENQMDEARNAFSRFGDISDDTAERIAELRKEMSGSAAEAYVMADVMRDVGLSQENLNGFWVEGARAIKEYAKGELTADQATESLTDSFGELLAGAQKFGTEGSAAMLEFIKRVKESGLEIAGVTDYINDQLGIVAIGSMSAAEGLVAMSTDVMPGLDALVSKQKDLTKELKGVREGSEEYEKLQDKLGKVNGRLDELKEAAEGGKGPLGELSTRTMSVFNAMIANGASAAQAMDSIGGTLDTLIARYDALGVEAPASIAELLKIREVQNSHEGLFNAIDGNLAVLGALANTGSLTQESMTQAANQTQQYFNRLKGAGLTSNQALSQMAPTLERLRFLQKEHGLEVGIGTQKLIDQAEQQGLLKEEAVSANDVMMAGFGAIIEALGGDIPAAFQTSMDKMKDFGEEGTTSADAVMGGLDEIGTELDTEDWKVKMSADDTAVYETFKKLKEDPTLSPDDWKMELTADDTAVYETFKKLKEDTELKAEDWKMKLTADDAAVYETFKEVKNGINSKPDDWRMDLSANDKAVREAFRKLKEDLEKGTITIPITTGTPRTGEPPKTQAQFGFHGTVTGPHLFAIEPGKTERVDIDPTGQGNPEQSGGGGTTAVVINQGDITPVVIPWRDMESWLIKFVKKASKDERLIVHPKSVRTF